MDISEFLKLDRPDTTDDEGLLPYRSCGGPFSRRKELMKVKSPWRLVPLTTVSLSRAAQNDAVCCGPKADAVDRCK